MTCKNGTELSGRYLVIFRPGKKREYILAANLDIQQVKDMLGQMQPVWGEVRARLQE